DDAACLAGLHRPTAGTGTVLGGPPRGGPTFLGGGRPRRRPARLVPGAEPAGAPGTGPDDARAGPGLVPADRRAHRGVRAARAGRRGPDRPVPRPATAAAAGGRAGPAQPAAAARRAGAEPGPRIP